jgi:hypothetical protein
MTTPMHDANATARPTVQLLHELPDGSSHVDWMLAMDAAGERPLLTFRLDGRVDELSGRRSLLAEHIGDHRPAYLTYEGLVSGDRGTVTRLRAGIIENWREAPGMRELEIAWEGREPRRQRVRMKRVESAIWAVSVIG